MHLKTICLVMSHNDDTTVTNDNDDDRNDDFLHSYKTSNLEGREQSVISIDTDIYFSHLSTLEQYKIKLSLVRFEIRMQRAVN